MICLGSGLTVKKGADLKIDNVTEKYAVLGLSGPDTPRIATALNAEWMNEIGYFQHREGQIGNLSVRAARLSYVGEAGWELTCPAQDAQALYDLLAKEGVRPVGAFAQTAMRIEKGFLSYGHDLDTDVTPQMAGLEFALVKDKAFIGKHALTKRGHLLHVWCRLPLRIEMRCLLATNQFC